MVKNITAEPVVSLVEAAVVEYNAATGAEKVKVRSRANEAALAAMRDGAFDVAQAWSGALERMVPAKPAKAEVNYAEQVARRVAILRAAANLLERGEVRPAGIPDDVELGDLPDFEGDEAADEAARKMAGEKVTRSAERRSIADVIVRAFEVTGATSLKLSEIARHGATPDYAPSQGAVAARMFGGSGVEGFVAVEATSDAPRTVRKAA